MSTLIDPPSLATKLDAPDWIVVDCRFNLLDPAAGRKAYARAHIPGARYADLDRDLARPPVATEGRHPLPDVDTFVARLGEWGVGAGDTVVVYDEDNSIVAARLWWLLRWVGHERVHVLDGGLAAWQDANLPLESTAPRWAAKTYAPRQTGAMAVVSTDDLPGQQARGGQLVDVRAAPRFRGEQEPIDPIAGHVPGARNRPFSANVTETGRFRPAEELRRELLELLENRPAETLIAMCGSGVTACHLLLSMDVAGLDVGKLYAGSWSEWIRDASRPIKTGSAP